MKTIAREAYSIALTPAVVREEWAAKPWTVSSMRLIDLCAVVTRMRVGSPTMQIVGRTSSPASSWTICAAPRQPSSSP
jgi:hypothetical protein